MLGQHVSILASIAGLGTLRISNTSLTGVVIGGQIGTKVRQLKKSLQLVPAQKSFLASHTQPSMHPSMADNTPNGANRTHPPSKLKCHACKRVGHIQKDCDAPKCYHCGEYGHYKSNCNVNFDRPETQQAFAGFVAHAFCAAQSPLFSRLSTRASALPLRPRHDSNSRVAKVSILWLLLLIVEPEAIHKFCELLDSSLKVCV
jgi:hypothetical protein